MEKNIFGLEWGEDWWWWVLLPITLPLTALGELIDWVGDLF